MDGAQVRVLKKVNEKCFARLEVEVEGEPVVKTTGDANGIVRVKGCEEGRARARAMQRGEAAPLRPRRASNE
jgi:hypothetical protein